MNTIRPLIMPLAKVAIWHAGRQLRHFMSLHKKASRHQNEFMQQLVAHHKDTAFGVDHGFRDIHTYRDFARLIPVGEYEDRKPYVKRTVAGETTALLPEGEPPLMFSMTSGTTGEPKHIPVTNRFLTHLRRGWNILGVRALTLYPQAIVRPILQISSSTEEETSPSGVPCGAISGLLASTQKRIVRKMYVTPPWASTIEDPVNRFYTIMRFAIERDVAIITTANPSSTIKLIETAQNHIDLLLKDLVDGTYTLPDGSSSPVACQGRFRPNPEMAKILENAVIKDGQLLPRHFWNVSFLTNWTGGTLFLYIKRLRKMFDTVPIHDIGLLASEGRFSIPMDSNEPYGIAEIASNFLEFIPASERKSSNPITLRSHELEVGEEYFLVFSNYTGLFRYNLDDRIRVTDMFHETPVFEFMERGLSTANITGEKITESQVVDAMKRASLQLDMNVELFELQGRFASIPYYELRIEASDNQQAVALCNAFDDHLCRINIEYNSKRKSQRLDPIQPVILQPGTFDRMELEKIKSHRGRAEQYKHQYLLTDILEN